MQGHELLERTQLLDALRLHLCQDVIDFLLRQTKFSRQSA